MMNDDDGVVQALVALYRRGESMEFIAEAMELPLVYVSQVVHLLGLGEERYGHKGIPSDGSTPVVRNVHPGDGRTVYAFKALNRR